MSARGWNIMQKIHIKQRKKCEQKGVKKEKRFFTDFHS